MTRLAVGIDRLMAAVAGLGLLAGAALTVAWCAGRIGGGRPLRCVLTAGVHAAWWPWAAAVGGILLILVGLRWLLAHRRAPRARRIALATTEFTATADVTAAAAAAAAALRTRPAVVKASGVATVEHGAPTVTLTVTVPARHGLTYAAAAADDVAGTLAAMFGDAVAVRTVVRVDAKRAHAAVV